MKQQFFIINLHFNTRFIACNMIFIASASSPINKIIFLLHPKIKIHTWNWREMISNEKNNGNNNILWMLIISMQHQLTLHALAWALILCAWQTNLQLTTHNEEYIFLFIIFSAHFFFIFFVCAFFFSLKKMYKMSWKNFPFNCSAMLMASIFISNVNRVCAHKQSIYMTHNDSLFFLLFFNVTYVNYCTCFFFLSFFFCARMYLHIQCTYISYDGKETFYCHWLASLVCCWWVLLLNDDFVYYILISLALFEFNSSSGVATRGRWWKGGNFSKSM